MVLKSVIVLLLTFHIIAVTSQDLSQKDFLTTKKIVSAGVDPPACDARVLDWRKNHAGGGDVAGERKIGVEPTVGLGSAILIFLLVGVIAALIATTFHTVNNKQVRGYKIEQLKCLLLLVLSIEEFFY